jgi:hypothetical protein
MKNYRCPVPLYGTGYLHKEMNFMQRVTIQFSYPLLYDRLTTLAAEYDLTVDFLVSLAVKRLLADVELVRNLRAGKAELN